MLPARFRLSGSDTVGRVFRQGVFDTSGPFGFKWITGKSGETSRIGILAGKKLFPTATARNHAKRMAREATRPFLAQLKPGYDILILYRYRPERFILEENIKHIGAFFHRRNLLK